MTFETQYFEPETTPERELPARRFELVDIGDLSPERRDELHQKGFEFLTTLDPDSYFSRFGTGKPSTPERLNKDVIKFLRDKAKRPHYMIAAFDENDAIMGALSMFDLKNVAPNCAEISYTVLKEHQGKGLGTALFKESITWLQSQGYGHILGYFEKEGANKHIFDTQIGAPIAGNSLDGYYYRIVEHLNQEQRITEAAIKTYFETKDIHGTDSASQTKEQREKAKNRAIRKLYRFFKKWSTLPAGKISDTRSNDAVATNM